MNYARKLYHFLGGLNFAIFLIMSSALMVIVGTAVESKTNSHQYAAKFTYESPFFLLLMAGYFLNILISALRRWPFKKNHIPFLITHLGLLMILSGVIVKNLLGLQGSLHLIEGTASDKISIPNSYSLRVEKLNSVNPLKNPTFFYDLKRQSLVSNDPPEDFKIKSVKFYPHAEQFYRSWIFEKDAIIQGLKPFKFRHLSLGEKISKNPPSTAVRFYQDLPLTWELYAFKTQEELRPVKQFYAETTKIKFTDFKNQNTLEASLEQVLDGIAFGNLLIKGTLDFFENEESATLSLETFFNKERIHLQQFFLDESNFLLQKNLHTSVLYSPLKIEFERQPALLLIQNANFETTVWHLAKHGVVSKSDYPSSNLSSLIAYGEGFGGYTLRYPLIHFEEDPLESRFRILLQQLGQTPIVEAKMPPPLQKLYHAASKAKISFASFLLDFLQEWQKHGQLLGFPENELFTKVFQLIEFSPEESKALSWIIRTYQALTENALLANSSSLASFFKSQPQTIFKGLQELETDHETLSYIGQQLLSSSSLLSDIPIQPPQQLFCAYCLAYGISYSNLYEAFDKSDILNLPKKEIFLESPLRMVFKASEKIPRPEDQTPVISLEIEENNIKQKLALPYDKTGNGLRWPTASNRLLLRFEPKSVQIPYRIRLYRANQENYLNSEQAASYEGHLLFENIAKNAFEESIIKMNKVHEVKEGHRFYLANVSESSAQAKRVHIIVNHDPAKYWLTYPGGIILSIGIFLFLMRFKRKSFHKSV